MRLLRSGVFGLWVLTACAGPSRTTASGPTSGPAASSWHSQALAGLSLELPGREAVSPVPDELPEEVRASLVEGESYSLNAEGTKVSVRRFRLRPEAAGDMEAALQGAVEEISKLPGVSDLQLSRTDVTVSGLQGAKETGSCKAGAQRIDLAYLVLGGGRTYWMVVAVSEAPGTPDRIVSSVTVQAPAGGR